ncbi:MAG: hypothetical protein JRN62_04245 [Nitrososphaerota archaeon]|jgi:hypothetical protein|nr:hypothetical protein [Nitrososphaerota archaeon]MDG6948814.1 hypothetical protein [Nitrososphaerota archaeon]
MKQQVAVRVAQSGGSLYLVLTKQLEDISAKVGDKLVASWDDDGAEIVIKRDTKP